ncbi:MAG: hypothetical protein V2A58_03505 [Planctomycetota bacterium]
MPVHVRVGGATWSALEYVKRFVEGIRCGDLVCPGVGRSYDDAFAMARYCRKRDVAVILQRVFKNDLGRRLLTFDVPKDSAHRHGFYTQEEYRRILKEFGFALVGRMTLNEIGGTIYWPRYYVIDRAVGEWPALDPAKDMAAAKRSYLRLLRKVLRMDRRWAPDVKLVDGDASILFKYHREAGVDLSMLELMPADPDLAFAAVRGASRDAPDPRWIAYIAMDAYGGKFRDELFFKRWRVALYGAYLAGASFIVSESGHFESEVHGNRFDSNAPETKRYRRELRNFHRFCLKNPRPERGPAAAVGVVHGHLDGYSGLWSRQVWGQFAGDHWKHGPPEWGWDYLEVLHRKQSWSTNTVVGDTDYSGNPPDGQYDLVPIESSQKNLNRYRCLVFLGWNTMTPGIYRKLKRYVRQGGHLFMSVPHLSVETRRDRDFRLYRKGDFRDLFGVRVLGPGRVLDAGGFRFIADSSLPAYRFPFWSATGDPKYIGGDIPTARVKLAGARVLAVTKYQHRAELETWREPLLVEHRIGRGVAFLLTAWAYPGLRSLAPFVRDLLRAMVFAEQGDVRLVGTDKFRYAVYEEGRRRTVYVLNTDFDSPHRARIRIGAKALSLLVPPARMRIVRDGRIVARKRLS